MNATETKRLIALKFNFETGVPMCRSICNAVLHGQADTLTPNKHISEPRLRNMIKRILNEGALKIYPID